MSRISLLNSPLLLGFDEFERTLERIAKAPAEGYPPYNIERTGEDKLRITLAVAGFTLDDLDILLEDNQLTINGRQAAEDQRVYLHRGIATRQFKRSFVIAEGVEITSAVLDNGLLHIDLRQPKPQRTARSIKITSGGSAAKGATIDVSAKEA
ncbi:MAG: Hsp20 family protein [Alphaproteobacteria bacterium]|nr:Hsp20 family protein [Alphaproteobacteria bacterium]MCZ6592260.1 Hsp20 family protein [Alphaproteobacteria bacterium]MCZ6838254.1 Hsp20 family protein [Alphaproteobacteria bacterium]